MTSKTWGRKFIAGCVAVAVLSVYSMVVLASPGARVASGEMSIVGNVAVNGQKVISGGTFFSDGVIATADQSSATVNISRLGRVELAPNTSLRLSFTDNSIMGLLEAGSAQVATLAGVSVTLTTKDSSIVVDGSEATSFGVTVEKSGTALATQAGRAELRSGGAVKLVAAGESATVGMPLPQTPPSDDGLSGGRLAVLLLAAGGAIAAIIIAATHDNDINFGGTINVVSPVK
ncbi:MAG TPA: hypothetical protein VJ124_08210 [Pyrinomonadaceae bacterium]|nr:hypothetical protein [Pyrinomonadaceae bacterium]